LWHRSDADIAAAKQLVRAVRNAENFVRTRQEQISPSARVAIAARYSSRLDILEFGDPAEFEEVMGWISELRLRSAPHGSPLPARILTFAVGLTNALKIKFALRRALGRLRGTPSG
jgi:hypothetical protein